MALRKKKYKDGDVLAEDEYLLRTCNGTGYLCKLNKNGSLKKNFLKWCNSPKWIPSAHHEYGGFYVDQAQDELDIRIHKEEFASGWEFVSFRGGESQDWAILMHPEGFLLEVYIHTLIDMIGKITIKKGVLQGKFKWSYSKLIKE